MTGTSVSETKYSVNLPETLFVFCRNNDQVICCAVYSSEARSIYNFHQKLEPFSWLVSVRGNSEQSFAEHEGVSSRVRTEEMGVADSETRMKLCLVLTVL